MSKSLDNKKRQYTEVPKRGRAPRNKTVTAHLKNMVDQKEIEKQSAVPTLLGEGREAEVFTSG
jgi:hypothetical protein